VVGHPADSGGLPEYKAWPLQAVVHILLARVWTTGSLPTAGDSPDGLSTATAVEGAGPNGSRFRPWITRIDPSCGLLGSLRVVATCVPAFPNSHSVRVLKARLRGLILA
jgi:hypothetical protein